MIMPDEESANSKIEKRKLGTQRRSLTEYGKELARQVAAEKLKPDAALDLFYGKAGALTSSKGDALLVAAGSALDLRHTMMDVNGKRKIVGSVLTKGSLGEDSLHHFAFAAFNAYDNFIVPAQTVGNVANWAENPANTDSWPDIVGNSAGAHFAAGVLEAIQFPETIGNLSVGRNELDRLRTHKEYKPAVIK